MPPEKNQSPLERMRRSLYTPEGTKGVVVPTLHAPPELPAEAWKQAPPAPPRKRRLPHSIMFLIGTVAFFTVAVIVAAGLVLFGGRTVSTENIEITVEPSSPTVGSGDTIALLIRVKNGNPVAITSTALSVEFPEGTRAPLDVTQPLTHYSDTLGDLSAGQASERTVQAVMFGSEGQKVTIPIRLEYRTAGSNASFIKETSYEFVITTSPLSVSVGSLSQVSAGQPFTVAVTVRSNAVAAIENATLAVTYPPGFVASGSTPAPISGSVFDLGRITPGEEKRVTITGTLTAEDQETRFFTLVTGTRTTLDSDRISVPYTTTQVPVTLERPFLATTLSLNRDTSGALILKTGQQVDGVLSFINTLQSTIQDASITVALAGTALDRQSVKTANGFYRSQDGKIIFSKETIPSMREIAPGETGMGSFSFSTLGDASATSLRNPTVTLTVSAQGRRLDERNVASAVNSVITRTLKVETDLALQASALRTEGPITNTGPWPPLVDKESTYTIAWTLSNTVNSVANAKVVAELPSYVRFTGVTSPSDGTVTYNATTRTVSWNAGDIAAGTAQKTMYFQVAFLPSASQRGTSPTIVTAQKLTGVDRFTEGRLESVVGALTTMVTSDSALSTGSGQVQ